MLNPPVVDAEDPYVDAKTENDLLAERLTDMLIANPIEPEEDNAEYPE